jgi:hypothetical protein
MFPRFWLRWVGLYALCVRFLRFPGVRRLLPVFDARFALCASPSFSALSPSVVRFSCSVCPLLALWCAFPALRRLSPSLWRACRALAFPCAPWPWFPSAVVPPGRFAPDRRSPGLCVPGLFLAICPLATFPSWPAVLLRRSRMPCSPFFVMSPSFSVPVIGRVFLLPPGARPLGGLSYL